MADEIPVLSPFNPLDRRSLAESVTAAMLERPAVPLPPAPFTGAGIYAIYYVGDFPPYRKLAEFNRRHGFARPIYVGKAVPPGARKGGFRLSDDPGTVLYNRLCEHAESIEEAENLSIGDFFCRFLSVDDIWIPLGESLLIEKFSPLWNLAIDGFGNHDPGKGRISQKRSLWDTVHPGRGWALRLNRLSVSEDDLRRCIESFLDALHD